MTALAAAALLLAASMALAWRVGLRHGSGWIDTIWTFAVGAAALLALALAEADPLRRLLVAALVGAWSARLGLHIAVRTRRAPHDPRYAALMAQWGAQARMRLFMFLQVQAAAGFVLVAAAVLAAQARSPAGSPATLALAALAAAAIFGEAKADAQLAAFRRRGDKGAVCDRGLWALSRHPNYFFEWLFWAALAAMALTEPGPFGWAALAAPAMMYAVLRHGSGVPHLEAHLRRTRPDAFARYADSVPVFFPDLRRLIHGWPRAGGG